ALALGAVAVVAVGRPGTSAQATSTFKLAPIQQRLLSGFLYTSLQESGVLPGAPAAAAASGEQPAGGANRPYYFPAADGKCSELLGSNVKVNQNCKTLVDPALQGRSQAQNETSIAQDPNDPSHLVASANDYRHGDANCVSYFSSDDG